MLFRLLALCLPLYLVLSFFSAAGAAEGWPQWRGPAGQGHADAKDLPLTWSEKEHVAWRCPLPGKGWSSPVVEGNDIWMTTAVESPLTEAEKKERLKSNTGDQPLTLSGRLSLRAVCVDRTSGKVTHDVELLTEDTPDPVHALNSFASPSPILEGGRLYCHFGTNGTACLDTKTQQVVWRNQKLRIRHENGPGSTPVLYKNLLIFHCDGSDQQYIVALDAKTGEVAWKTARSGELRSDPQLKKAYGTPLVMEIRGKTVLVSPAADWLYGYDPATGEELWRLSYGGLGFSIVPRPVTSGGRVFMCTSFMQSELLAVDVENASQPSIAWRYKKQVPSMPSPILVEDLLYMISDKGVLTCLDAKTGEMVYSERVGGNFCSSPILADGRIYLMSREGLTTVFAPGRTFKTLAANQLEGSIMASPVALDRALYIRTDKGLYRIEKK